MACRFTTTGHHTGDLPGFPATGLPVEITGAVFAQVVDGKVVSYREILDHDSLRAVSTR